MFALIVCVGLWPDSSFRFGPSRAAQGWLDLTCPIGEPYARSV